MGLLTPVIKGVLTDKGFDNAVAAQQVFGGHGYIEEWGMEQFVRDARIAMIYEGANGIQALDLVGRKLPKDGGRAMRAFLEEVERLPAKHRDNEAMVPLHQAAAQGREGAAGGHDVADAERHEEPRQCGRRLHRLHAPHRALSALATCGR